MWWSISYHQMGYTLRTSGSLETSTHMTLTTLLLYFSSIIFSVNSTPDDGCCSSESKGSYPFKSNPFFLGLHDRFSSNSVS